MEPRKHWRSGRRLVAVGEVIAFPVKEKSCYDCVNALFTGSGTTFCGLFREHIMSEKFAAQDCDGYEPE